MPAGYEAFSTFVPVKIEPLFVAMAAPTRYFE
jgi:hypothetical protein